MTLWISCQHGAKLVEAAASNSHDAVHGALEEMLARHNQEGRRVRNILRNGEPAWDVVDESGVVNVTYWISRGTDVLTPHMVESSDTRGDSTPTHRSAEK
jgi:hypothetical protein